MKFKSYLFRFFVLAVILLIASSDMYAQRGWGRSRHYSRGYYHGPRVYSFARPYVSIGFGGVNYRYHGGSFYRPFPGYYRAVAPPFGISVNILPPGYRRVYVGPNPYYYYNGTYYSERRPSNYEVVKPPLGARVPELPKDAQVTVIDGQKYYEYDGIYYKEEITDKDEIWYTVVGTDGVLDTDNDGDAIAETTVGDKIGDKVDKLPENCRAIVISGKKYYEAPSGLYYEEVISPNKVYYEVVGKSDE